MANVSSDEQYKSADKVTTDTSKYVKIFNSKYRIIKHKHFSTCSHFPITSSSKPTKRKPHRYTISTRTPKKYCRTFEKVIVFDLDETLGSFSELHFMWNRLVIAYDINMSKEDKQQILFALLDIYPEFIRPGMADILEYVARRKHGGECMAVLIYTNNQNPQPWADFIADYFNHVVENKTGVAKIFDHIINAFKIGKEHVELLRTTHTKTYDDFIRCSLLPNHTEICFIDNTKYNSMIVPNVFYIQPKSYYHHLSAQDIVQKFVNVANCKNDTVQIILNKLFPLPKTIFKSQKYNNQLRLTQIKKFAEQIMIEYEQKIRDKNCGLSPRSSVRSAAADSPETDKYVSDCLMHFIREFFIMTTLTISTAQKTRKKKPQLLTNDPTD